MKVGETYSDETTLDFGVAQGSILGPPLFNAYTRTFPGRVKVTVKFTVEGYADDLTLLLRSLGLRMDIHQVKEVLKILEGFREISGLTVNKSKTQICTFGPRLDT